MHFSVVILAKKAISVKIYAMCERYALVQRWRSQHFSKVKRASVNLDLKFRHVAGFSGLDLVEVDSPGLANGEEAVLGNDRAVVCDEHGAAHGVAFH